MYLCKKLTGSKSKTVYQLERLTNALTIQRNDFRFLTTRFFDFDCTQKSRNVFERTLFRADKTENVFGQEATLSDVVRRVPCRV